MEILISVCKGGRGGWEGEEREGWGGGEEGRGREGGRRKGRGREGGREGEGGKKGGGRGRRGEEERGKRESMHKLLKFRGSDYHEEIRNRI